VVTNAQVLANRLVERGFRLVSGGTDNHLMLVDLGESCSGKDAEDALGRAAITVNKNTVLGEKRSPFVTSGIRVGTPAMTTRGMKEQEARQVADWIADVVQNRDNTSVLDRVRGEVHEVCKRFPVYPENLLA
jgi:glycine hydroxymethyltransferase